ncbi:hypothetical protein HYT24_02375 [Candidatus Pacearchaeota archaeon]|nr:hypothetical protein [Candidatus Pacearchaeota archaeon]
MIDHTIQQVEDQRKEFVKRKYQLHVHTNLGGRLLSYYIVPQDYYSPLPDFIIRATNNSTKNYVIGVSDSVPQELRPFFALAEYVEFVEMRLRQRGRVMAAEEEIMKVIPTYLRSAYIERKIRLYEKELELDRKDPDVYLLGEEGREEFSDTINFLRRRLGPEICWE